MKLVLLLLICLLPLSQAWSEEVYDLYINDVVPNCNETVDFLEVCSTDNLIRYAKNKDCFGQVNAAYQHLCLHSTDSTCEQRLNIRIAKWWGTNWTFQDCGISLSWSDIVSMEQEFGREIVLNDSFVDFRPKNFYIGTNSPQTNENGYDFEQPKDEGGGGQLFGPNTPTPALDLVLQNGFSFLYLSWIYGIPVFFIWSSILFIAIYGVWKSNLSGESTAAETLVDHENKKVMRTWWNIERTKFSFTIKTWLLFVITMAILSFILPIIGLAQFSTIVPIVFAVIGLLLVKAMF